MSCGIDAETFGSLMTLASGRVTSSPELGEVVADPLLGGERVGEGGEDPAGERDVAQLDLDPGDAVKALMTGSSERVASAGASSVWV